MLNGIRQRNPGRGFIPMLSYQVSWLLSRLVFALVYRLRVSGQENMPASGPVLLVPNHQSNLDPIVAGMPFFRRHINFIAKSGLFKNPIFGGYIRSLNAVPIKQGTADLGAIRLAIDQLAMGRVLLIFPEGSRTPDGAMHPFKRGAWLILSKAKCPVLPVAIEGAYDAFPRGTSRPRLWGRRIAVRVGKPIPAEELLAMGDQAGLEHIRTVIESMRVELAAELRAKGYEITTKPMSGVEIDE